MPDITLTTRYGHSHEQPSDLDLEAALKELFVEDDPSLTEADHEEHPNAWLTHGEQNGDKWTIHTLDVYRDGTVIFSKMDDQDDDEPAFEKEMDGVDHERTLKLWKLLAHGEMDALMAELRP